MKKTRRILVLVLILCLTLPFRTLTTEASTRTVTNFDELYVAVDNAHDGDTIIIGAVIPIEWGVYMNDSCKDITLQRSGNGKIQFINPYGEYNNSFWFNITFDCQGVSPEEFFDTRCENFDVFLTDCRFINTPASEPETDQPTPPTESGGEEQGQSGTEQTEEPSTGSGTESGNTDDTNNDTSDTDHDTDLTPPSTEGGQESTESGSGTGSEGSGSDSSGNAEEGQEDPQEDPQQPSEGGQIEGEGTLTPPSEDPQEPPSDSQTGTDERTGSTVPPEEEQPESGTQEGTQHPSDDGGTIAPPSNETNAPEQGGTDAPNTQPNTDSTLEEPQQGGTETGHNTQPEQSQNGQGDIINNYVTNDNTVTNNDNSVTYYTTDSGTQQQNTQSVMTVPSGSNVTIFINGEQLEVEQGQEGLTITINAGQTEPEAEEQTEAVTEEQTERNYLTGNLTQSEDLQEGVEGHTSSFSWSIFFDIIQTILLLGIVLILLRNHRK